MTHLVCWPHHGASKNMRRVLEVYAGQPPEILSLFRKDPAWGRCVTLRLTTPAVAIGARRAILLNHPEVIEALCKGIKAQIIKSVRDDVATSSDKEKAPDEAEPEPTDAAAILRAARRKHRQ